MRQLTVVGGEWLVSFILVSVQRSGQLRAWQRQEEGTVWKEQSLPLELTDEETEMTVGWGVCSEEHMDR